MGLRINTNIASLTGLNQLKINDRKSLQTLERLSTGLRINRASDDPSGFVISQILQQQVSGLKQAAENTQNATNMINTADAALGEITDLLQELKGAVVFALNNGTASQEQILAEQDVVDQIVKSVDRLATTTRYGGKALLNGQNEFQLTTDRPDLLDDLFLRQISFPIGTTSRSVTVKVETSPLRGTVTLNNVSADAGATLRITGNRGTAQVSVASAGLGGASSIARAVNTVAALTGVYASASLTGNSTPDVTLFTEDYGSKSSVRVEVMSGTVSGTAVIDGNSEVGPFTQGEVLFDTGTDGIVSVGGKRFTGIGREFNIVTDLVDFEFKLDTDLLPFTSSVSFTVQNTGLTLQLNESTALNDHLNISISSVNSANIGMDTMNDRIEEAINGGTGPTGTVTKGGFLSSIITGEGSSIINNPRNSNVIIEAALERVSRQRSFLGSVGAGTLEPNLDYLRVHEQELTESLSGLRDLDFAEESSKFIRNQIIFQSNIGVLAAANSTAQGVLTLLGF
ncbi:MAG: flagellin [Planctomycetes bacterium]|nr:flagellin [Planctomycetota bacterium]